MLQPRRSELKRLLSDRLQVLIQEVDESQRLRSRLDDPKTAEVSDRKDEAMSAVHSGLSDVQITRDIEEVALIRAALQRLENGSYGVCMDCEAAIPIQRLLAEPFASRCVGCQASIERC